MPAYHSKFVNDEHQPRIVGNMAVLALKANSKGPAPKYNGDGEDIVDEAISLFRANCFFRNFEIKGPADRTLIYAILYVGECLKKIGSMNRGSSKASLSEVTRALNTMALSSFAIPGDPSFPLNALYEKPSEGEDVELMRTYLGQVRQEIDTDGGKKPSKWWMSFQKRKFMNKKL